MKRIAYIDCQSGISGDMILGALVDAGTPLEELERQLSNLHLKGYRLKAKRVKRLDIKATKVDVEVQGARDKGQEARRWKDIKETIESSALPDHIKQKGLNIFKRLFQAEARVHGCRIEKVHLHELSAVDCIVDIMGTLIGFEYLGIDEVYSSPVNLGSGSIKTSHGRLPVPAPATIELLRGRPVYSTDVNFELTTPTGAVIISSIADGFSYMPEMEISRIGVGAGSKDFKNQPNVLRLFIGEGKGQGSRVKDQGITVIETNIDDMNPQIYEYLMEKLFKSGALDVFLTNIIMKKGRPGIKLTVLCSEDQMEKIAGVILRETTTIGLRFYNAGRIVLQRETKSIYTRFGKMSVKISRFRGELIKVSPEYSDCLRIAKRHRIPLLDVMKEIESLLTTDSYK